MKISTAVHGSNMETMSSNCVGEVKYGGLDTICSYKTCKDIDYIDYLPEAIYNSLKSIVFFHLSCSYRPAM